MHTPHRRDHRSASSRASHVGNIYVNRNMIGAVVGVQPFGGEGLSGTGPKAGGPLYLQRLLSQRPPLEAPARELAGPVGERNSYGRRPKGTILCVAARSCASCEAQRARGRRPGTGHERSRGQRHRRGPLRGQRRRAAALSERMARATDRSCRFTSNLTRWSS